MSILSGKEIRKLNVFEPYHQRTVHKESGTSYGEGPASYDITLAESIWLRKGRTILAHSAERFTMPNHVCASVKDKSTWARLGIDVKNTFIDPGWCGFLTLEIGYHPVFIEGSGGLYAPKNNPIYFKLEAGTPIAQIVFQEIIGEVEPYNGKYQNQGKENVPAKFE